MTIQTGIQKSKCKVKKHIRYPNKETLFSYYMQAIEPNNEAINESFSPFHPMWVIQSQKNQCSGERFKLYRQQMLKITQVQCAAYLRVAVTTVSKWENGTTQTPFMAMELLRLVFESPEYKLSNNKWAGWFINNNGELVSPDTKDLSFSPHHLTYVRQILNMKSFYETEYKNFHAEIEPLRAEVIELRSMLNQDNILSNLEQMEASIKELVARLKTNNVIPLKPNFNEQTIGAKVA